MASSAKQLSILIFLTLFFSLQIHARESQFFNKVHSNNNENNNVFEDSKAPKEPLGKQEETPYFIPQTENGYGLYGHESSQLPPRTTTTSTEDAPYKTTTNLPYNAKTKEPLNKAYLPSNYNPVAYVTKPEGYRPQTFENEPKGMNNANLPKKYNTEAYETVPQRMNDANLPKNYNTKAYVTEPQGMNEANLPKNYNTEFYVTEPQGLNDANLPKAYVTGPQGMSDTRFVNTDDTAVRDNHYNGKSGGNFPVQQQGMSDTRFLENGRYYHDVNNEKYSRNAYENAKVRYSRTEQNNKAFYGISDNTYEYNKYNNNNNNNYNSMQRFQNEEDQLQDSQQDEYPWP